MTGPREPSVALFASAPLGLEVSESAVSMGSVTVRVCVGTGLRLSGTARRKFQAVKTLLHLGRARCRGSGSPGPSWEGRGLTDPQPVLVLSTAHTGKMVKARPFPRKIPRLCKSPDLTNHSSVKAFEDADCRILPWSESKPMD